MVAPLTNKLRSDANHCFVCGPKNLIGLQLIFRLDGDICRAEFTPTENHCGYDGVTHGGLIYSVLDDAMANWVFLQGIRAYTAKCDIRYNNPLPISTPVTLEARCNKQRRRLILMQGRMLRADNDELIATTEARFMVIPTATA